MLGWTWLIMLLIPLAVGLPVARVVMGPEVVRSVFGWAWAWLIGGWLQALVAWLTFPWDQALITRELLILGLVGLVAVVCMAVRDCKRRRAREGEAVQPQPRATIASRWACAVVAAALVYLLPAWVGQWSRPYVDGDESLIWVSQARERSRAVNESALGEALRDPGRVDHGDYPPLLPVWMALQIEATQRWHGPELRLPVWLAWSWLFLLVGQRRDWRVGCLALLCVFATDEALRMRPYAFVDPLLALGLLLATWSALGAEKGAEPQLASRAAGGGLSGALLVMVSTKNEGLLMAVVLLPLAVLPAVFRPKGRRRLEILVGGLIALFVSISVLGLAAEREGLGLTNDLMTGNASKGSTFEILREEGWNRASLVVNWLLREIWFAPSATSGLLVMLVVGLALRARTMWRTRTFWWGVGLIVIAAGYSTVYLGTRYDVVWHLETSARRIHWVLLPAVGLVVLRLIQPPAEDGDASSFRLEARKAGGGRGTTRSA